VCGGKSCGGYEGKDGVKIGQWAEGRKLANCGLIVECVLVHRDKSFNSLLSNTHTHTCTDNLYKFVVNNQVHLTIKVPMGHEYVNQIVNYKK